jgi:hypothetical protein
MSIVFKVPGENDEVGAIGAACPGCGYELELHQPDESQPDRLLATCRRCEAWFLTTAEVQPLVSIPGTEPVGRRRSATRRAV